MLSLSRCRALLPQACALSDHELEALRDQLALLAHAAIDVFTYRPAEGVAKTDVLSAMSASETEDYEERAAVGEFEAGLPRDVAERFAVVQVLRSRAPRNVPIGRARSESR